MATSRRIRQQKTASNENVNNKRNIFSEKNFAYVTYALIAIVGFMLAVGFYIYSFKPPRETLISINENSYNAQDISRELGFYAATQGLSRTPLSESLLLIPQLLQTRFIYTQTQELVDNPSNNEVRLKASQLLKIKQDQYVADPSVLDSVLFEILKISDISSEIIFETAKSLIIQEKLYSIFSKEIPNLTELSFIKGISIEGEALASIFFDEYKNEEKLESLLKKYENDIDIRDVGWRISNTVGLDLPMSMNNEDILKLSEPLQIGRQSIFYYISEKKDNSLVTPDIKNVAVKVRLREFYNKAFADNVTYVENTPDSNLTNEIIIKASKIRLAIVASGLESPIQDWNE